MGGLALGAGVAALDWCLLRHPLTALIALTAWLRRQPGLRAWFAERENSVPGTAATRGVASRP